LVKAIIINETVENKIAGVLMVSSILRMKG